jgi:hypothetical protein
VVILLSPYLIFKGFFSLDTYEFPNLGLSTAIQRPGISIRKKRLYGAKEGARFHDLEL